MTSHSPRPLDSFLKRLPDSTQVSWIDEEERRVTAWPQRLHVAGFRSRAQLDRTTLWWLDRQGIRLTPLQKEVLRRHPAFRNLRQDPSFVRLTHQSKIQSRPMWTAQGFLFHRKIRRAAIQLLRRLRIR